MPNLVFGTGDIEAKIAFVGEAPGHQEARKGKPFVGKSGNLLTEMMTRAGITRTQCYITNVIKEKPYKNNIKPFIDPNKGFISQKAKTYIDMLKEELEESKANVIVAVGNVSLFILTGETGITSWRGSVLESTLLPGRKVIPIIHPAAALRMYTFKHFIQVDLNKIAEESKFPEIRRKEREYIIGPSYNTCMEFLEKCNKADKVGFDIEVYNYEVSCISFAPNDREAICIPFTERGTEYFTPPQEYEIWKKIAEHLENPNIRHIAQNAIFDCSFLYKKYGIRVSNIEDTMVAQGICFPDFPKGLDFLASVHTDMPYYKEDNKFRNPKVTDKDFWIYNAKDSVILPEIFEKQEAELKKLGNYDVYRRQTDLITPLNYMMNRGIKMDTDLKDSKYWDTEQAINKVLKEIQDIVGYEINPNSPQQLQQYFYVERKIKPITEKGKITTNELALKKLAAKGQPVASKILEFRHLKTLSSRYYGMELDKDGRLRCSFNPVGTTTGRLSSSKTIFGTGANLQNQPPDMKKIMQPDEGYIAYEIDLGQAENRIVAYIGPDIRMMDAFESGADIHSRTAGMIFNMPEDEVRAMHKEWEKTGDKKLCAPIGTGDKTYRYWGKTANHAFNYDLGYVSFSRKYEIPKQDSKFIHSGYHSAYPGVRKMHEMVKSKLRANRTLENLLGRKRLFMDRWGDSLFKEAYAYMPQSTVADIINKYGLLEVYYNQEKYRPVELLNQVHDSIILQIRKSVGIDEHVRLLKDICSSLEVELEWHGKGFVIPAEVKALPQNFKDGIEIGTVTDKTDQEVSAYLSDMFK